MTIPRPGDVDIAYIESMSKGTMATFERGDTPYATGTLAPGNHQIVTPSDERDTGEGDVRERPSKGTRLEDRTVDAR